MRLSRCSFLVAGCLAAARPVAAGPPLLQLSAGFEAGGAPFLRPPGGAVPVTTAETSGNLFVRVSMPMLSTRVLEVGCVPQHGLGVMLQGNAGLRRFRLHLLDLGVFYDAGAPVTVARVPRSWDFVVGSGIDLPLANQLSLVFDARLFMPMDVVGVATHYGDTARLAADEIADGVQLWAGAAYSW